MKDRVLADDLYTKAAKSTRCSMSDFESIFIKKRKNRLTFVYLYVIFR